MHTIVHHKKISYMQCTIVLYNNIIGFLVIFLLAACSTGRKSYRTRVFDEENFFTSVTSLDFFLVHYNINS